jgi:site-specific DNA recombinase
MKKVAIYMRVSTAQQEEEQTIENQKIELDKRIKQDGHILLPEFIYKDEGWSGAILARPELDNLRSDALEGKFDTLYFYDRGRVSRIYFHQEVVFEALRERGIEIISLHDNNGTSEEDKLTSGFMGLFAQYERVKIAERMRIGKHRKVRENKKLLGYQPKYGYDYIKRIKGVKDGEFIINEEQAKVVLQIFEWVAEGWSKYAVRDELYSKGILPAKAKRDIWSTSVIDRMLRDTTYKGEHYYNKSESVQTKNPRNPELKYRKTVKGSRIARPLEEWMMTVCPIIVPPALFDKVQEQLARNKRLGKRNNKKNKYLVGGVLECVCGYARTGDPTKDNLYYRCNDRLNNACGTRKCFETGINATILDTLIWDNLKELLTQPELVFEQAKNWQEGTSPLLERQDSLKARLAKVDLSEGRYAKMYGEGVMPEQIYKDNVSQLNENRAKILAEMSGIQDELSNKPSIPLEKLVEGVIKLVSDLDFSNKKQIVQKIVTKVVATKKEVTVWGHIPVLATEKVGLDVKHSNTYNPNQLQNGSNPSEVGLDVKYRHRWAAECWQIHPF